MRAGQVLARVDSIELGQGDRRLPPGRARAELARETFEREGASSRDRVSSEQEMLTAQAAAREADAALRGAEEHLHLLGISDERGREPSATTSRALRFTRSGRRSRARSSRRHVTRGEMVEPQSQLFQIADLSRVWVWIDVYERDLARVHLGDGVEVAGRRLSRKRL